MPKSERFLLGGTAAISLLLRAIALFNYRFDSDEQQHLHVAWGWVRGGVQYRDFFDNHHPLFHLLTAPFAALVGERSTALLWMRLPMLVLFGVVMWGTYVLGRRLYDERAGLWAAVLLSLFPPFFLKSLEYRNDNLWTALSVTALVVLAGGALTKKRMFVFGLLLGCAFATSVKTVIVVIAIVGAGLVVKVFRRAESPPLHFAILGFVIVPGALAAFFAAVGAWDQLVYCTWTFNTDFARIREYLWIGRLAFPFLLAGLLYLAWRFRDAGDRWRYFFAVVAGLYVATLCCFWIVVSPRDVLPMMPVAAIFAAAWLRSLRALAVIVIALVASLWYYGDRFEHNTDWHYTMMDQVLRLSRPGETIIDIKGETIFRRRPTYPVFEIVTRNQVANGLIRDTVAADVIRTRTYIAQADGPMWPPQARAFLTANFLDMGRLRASGQWLPNDGTFTIAVPGEYMIVNERGEMRGLLDGTPYTGPRQLAAGAHRFVGRVEQRAVVWAPAVRRGHSPFHLRDKQF